MFHTVRLRPRLQSNTGPRPNTSVSLKLKPILLTITILICVAYCFRRYYWTIAAVTIAAAKPNRTEASDEYFALLEEVKIAAERINVEKKIVHLEEFDLHVVYRVASPLMIREDNPVVVLIHGIAEDTDGTSEVWLQVKTMQILAAHGFQVIAPDMPGTRLSETSSKALPESQNAEFLVQFLLALSISRPIVVGASWGGTFSIAYLLEHPDVHRAAVAVGTIYNHPISDADAERITAPVLFIQGEHDKLFGDRSFRKLAHVPTIRRVVVKGAKHAVFQQAPDPFHAALLEFLDSV